MNTFSLDIEVNTQNTRRYAPKKVAGQHQGVRPEQFRHDKFDYPQKVMVFLGVFRNGNTRGLKFLDTGTTMDGNYYYRLVRNRLEDDQLWHHEQGVVAAAACHKRPWQSLCPALLVI